MSAPDVLSVWTIYDHPIEYPAGFLARRYEASVPEPTPTTDTLTGPTLESVREQLPPGLVYFGRNESDPPHIIESWL